jgi:ceramide glucosyltransferase
MRSPPIPYRRIVLTAWRVVILVLAAGPFVFYLLCLYCIVGYFREARKKTVPSKSYTPPASILKPVRGADREAYENFASFCRLDYPQYELIFAAADREDPAVAIIERLQRNFPRVAIRLVAPVAQIGENRKVSNLCAAAREAKHEFLVMSDSDVRVEPKYLHEVVAPFADPAVGGVTSFYRCLGGGSFAANLDTLSMSVESVPDALVARKLEGNVQFAFGWTMATTKKILREIGGWEAMANHHSDDFELGNRIAKQGYRVELMREPVWMMVPKQSLQQFVRREMRWAIGLRNVRPSGYFGKLFTLGVLWTLAAVIVALSAGWLGIAIAYLAAYLVLRIGVAWSAGIWGLRDTALADKLWLVPIRDAVSAAVWIAGWFTNRIRWRGLEYRVKDKLLLPVGGKRD